jgi:hypothetical protein
MAQNQQSSGHNGETTQGTSIPGAYVSGPPPITGTTFGIELSEQIVSEGTEIPKVVEKCAQAIEAYGKLPSKWPSSRRTVSAEISFSLGLNSMGIYRLSGTTSKVQRLKAALDAGERIPAGVYCHERSH